MKKEKQSNFELLRIVAMLMIIIFHRLVNFVGTRDSHIFLTILNWAVCC